MASLGEKIKDLRLKEGLTLEDVAKKINTSKQTIHRYETGVISNIPAEKIEQLSKILNTTPSWLMGWDELDWKNDDISVIGELDYNTKRMIPILTKISADTPMYDSDKIDGNVHIEFYDKSEYFALRIYDDSMNAANILKGSIVIARKQNSVLNGEIAVVLIDNEHAFVRQVSVSDNGITLIPQSFNHEHIPKIFELKDKKVHILGKIVEVRLKM